MIPFAIGGLQLTTSGLRDNLPYISARLDYFMYLFPWVQMVVFSELAAYGPNPAKAEPLPGPAERKFQEMAAKLFDLANEGQVQRGLKRFALIAAAGELATAAGLTGWPDGAADKAALEVFGLWLDGRGGSGPDEARDALERVRAFLVAHGESRFEPIDKSVNDRLVANRAGWRDEDTFFISTDVWKEIHRGADPKRAALHLYDSGFLKKPGEKGRYTVRLPGKVKGRPHAYAVSAEIMGCGDG